MPAISLTYRPPLEVYKKLSIEEFKNIIVGSKVSEYYIGCECGDSDELTHFQTL